ncbi:MAG TPA: hypothetical protein PKY31_16340 [Spirochaetota bacterium]|nr:hypothetical protein [Spirochaetota bacterium]
MQREIRFDRAEDLIAELTAKGITRVAFSIVREKRPRQVSEKLLQLESTVILEILAYRDSTIYKCVLEGADIDETQERFASLGFDVTRRSRNIT